MWLFTIYGFFSISVQGKGAKRTVAVRARDRGHLMALQSRFDLTQPIQVNAATDYKFRIIVSMAIWTKVHAELLEEQIWSNFKNAAAAQKDATPAYIDALHAVWDRMYDLQVPPKKSNTFLKPVTFGTVEPSGRFPEQNLLAKFARTVVTPKNQRKA